MGNTDQSIPEYGIKMKSKVEEERTDKDKVYKDKRKGLIKKRKRWVYGINK